MTKFYNISYPGSGASWIRYIIQIGKNLSVKSMSDFKGLASDKQNYYCIKDHHATSINPDHNLILILRNYKECILSNHYKTKIFNFNNKQYVINTDYTKTTNLKACIHWYMNNLKLYDAFSNNKHLIYYEDMINDPRKMLLELQEFTQLDLGDIIDNLVYHQNKCKELYTKHWRKPHTDGKTAKYHTNKLTYDQQLEWDQLFYDYNPDLYKKYLKQYAYPEFIIK